MWEAEPTAALLEGLTSIHCGVPKGNRSQLPACFSRRMARSTPRGVEAEARYALRHTLARRFS